MHWRTRIERWRTRLTGGRTISPWVVDGVLAVGLAVPAVVQYWRDNPGLHAHVPAVLLFTLPLAIRRRHPLVLLGLQQLGGLLMFAVPPYTVLFAALFGLYSVCVYARTPWIAVAWLAAGVVALQAGLPGTEIRLPAALLELMGGLTAVAGGIATRGQQARARWQEERAEQLSREQQLVAQVAAAAERTRIARELHDIVVHSVGVMVIQAGAARMVGGQPPRAQEALRAVEETGREALNELRRLLGLLTAGEEDAELTPQPGLEQLDALVARVRSAGLPVELEVKGRRRPLPAGLDLTAYRVVQEALTNALKHSAGSATRVGVDFGEAELRLEVVDTGPPAGAPGLAAAGGHGLIGMRARVTMYGGELEAGPQRDGGFAVRVRLPLAAA
jgi:signal transduction histidine kinase